MFWCRSFGGLDCTDPQLRHDCCRTCASTLATPTATTSLPVTTSAWRDVTLGKSSSVVEGWCRVQGGDSASFCATMPAHECYYFPRLCCVRCARHYTGIPGRHRPSFVTLCRPTITTTSPPAQSNLGRAASQSPHWLQWDAPNSPPKLPLPFDDHHLTLDRPTRHPKGTRIQSAVWPQYTFRTDRQTDKPYGHYASRRRSGKNSRCYN